MSESRPYEGNSGCALEFGSEFCGNAITLEQEAYKKGKAEGRNEMHEIMSKVCYHECNGKCLNPDNSNNFCSDETCPIVKGGK